MIGMDVDVLLIWSIAELANTFVSIYGAIISNKTLFVTSVFVDKKIDIYVVFVLF